MVGKRQGSWQQRHHRWNRDASGSAIPRGKRRGREFREAERGKGRGRGREEEAREGVTEGERAQRERGRG